MPPAGNRRGRACPQRGRGGRGLFPEPSARATPNVHGPTGPFPQLRRRQDGGQSTEPGSGTQHSWRSRRTGSATGLYRKGVTYLSDRSGLSLSVTPARVPSVRFGATYLTQHQECGTLHGMNDRATQLQVLDFFGSAPLAEVEQVNRLARLLLKGRRAKVEDSARALPEPRIMPSALLPLPPRKAESIKEKAQEVLREAGTLMSAKELTDGINARFGSRHTKGSIVGGVARYIRKDDTFCRVGAGQYGLLESNRTRPPGVAPDGPALGGNP